jgi:predicted nucleic acid-binding protein
VTLLYADTSAILRAYFADESDHDALRAGLLEGTDPVVTSEVARVELASAVRSAAAAGRLKRWRGVLARMDADCGPNGPITLLALRSDPILTRSRSLVLEHRVRTLDAIYLAVALVECPSLSGEGGTAFVTRDEDQAAAASRLGFEVR